jgi:structure-specific endonuclease subunit SLX1
MDENQEQERPWYCYLLVSTEGQTYIGATIDPDRRLRQHNGEICGGARATAIRVGQGQSWERVCYVKGFLSKREALQFEWRWKYVSRMGVGARMRGLESIERRMGALYEILRDGLEIVF